MTIRWSARVDGLDVPFNAFSAIARLRIDEITIGLRLTGITNATDMES